MIRGVRTPSKSRLHPIALIENEEGIQASLMEIINALVRTIDFRRAQLILRALHIAVKNSPRVHFSVHNNEMVREVPDYPAASAPQTPASSAVTQAGALASIPRPKPISIAPRRSPAPAASPEPARRKPPAAVKSAPPARNAARRRSG
jgi:predicted component of type VI protein secretion system